MYVSITILDVDVAPATFVVRDLEFCKRLWDGAALGARVCPSLVVPGRPQRHLLEVRVTGLKMFYTPQEPLRVWRSLRSE